MSFLTDLRRELCGVPVDNPCCRRAMLCGMLLGKAACEPTENRIVLSLDPITAEWCYTLLEKSGVVSIEKKAKGRQIMLAFVSKSFSKYLAESEKGISAYTPKCAGCAGAFARGLFLAIGRAEDPERAYRLEFCPQRRENAVIGALSPIIGEMTRIRRRTESFFLVRNSTSVEDYFMHIGANEALFHVMNKKIEHQFRNDANRVANCEAGNIGKAVIGSCQQVAIFSKLEKEGYLSSLPPELEETARLRLAYPEMSVSQLASHLRVPISKSGMNHRLHKAMENAKRLLAINHGKEMP